MNQQEYCRRSEERTQLGLAKRQNIRGKIWVRRMMKISYIIQKFFEPVSCRRNSVKKQYMQGKQQHGISQLQKVMCLIINFSGSITNHSCSTISCAESSVRKRMHSQHRDKACAVTSTSNLRQKGLCTLKMESTEDFHSHHHF